MLNLQILVSFQKKNCFHKHMKNINDINISKMY